MKTREQRQAYNKEYFSRPEVRIREKIKNARPEMKEARRRYKKTAKGKLVNKISRQKHWKKNAPLREIQLMKRYGITVEQYQEMQEKQKNQCAICLEVPKTKLHVDHCHDTGRIRGLLCGNCNRGIGMFKDNPLLLQRANLYLS